MKEEKTKAKKSAKVEISPILTSVKATSLWNEIAKPIKKNENPKIKGSTAGNGSTIIQSIRTFFVKENKTPIKNANKES